MTLPDSAITTLNEALDNNKPPEVPGAAVAVLSEEGDWFGASGFSDLANNIPLEPDDRFEAGSITKTFIATTILQLTEEGQLALDDTLTDLLPTNITNFVPNANEITIEQILNHTSGIAEYVAVLSAGGGFAFVENYELEELVEFIDGVEPFFDPGTSWEYSNTNYILAGLVIESVTGNNYGLEIRNRIIDPLGLENTFVFGSEGIPGGYIKGYLDINSDGMPDEDSFTNLSWAGSAGSIISNTFDLAEFFDALLVEGELLQADSLEQMLDTIPINSPNYTSYGLGIGTIESPNRFWYAHRGQTLGFRSNLWYSPLEEITYVELFNGRSSSNLVTDILPTFRRAVLPPTPDIVTYEFDWTGQIAGFRVEGEFSYDLSQSYEDGIVREENLESFDISFFAPDGTLLRTYEDNHLTFPEFNFAFDTNTREILQDGAFMNPDGLNVGEKTPVGDGFTGLSFFSRPELNPQGEVPPPHLHFDDWADEFGFPLGFSTHEDVAFFTRTTQQLLDTGRVGETYQDTLGDTLEQFGNRIVVSVPENQQGQFEVISGATSLFLDFTLFENAGLIIQDGTPTATPFSNQFQVAFAIDEEPTDFLFDSVPFSPISGTINHTGDLTFLFGDNTLVIIGNFSIGYDVNRVSDTNSGFFVADTLEDGLGIDILFDVSIPERLIVADNELTIADAELLLAPELATILGIEDSIGADLGDIRIDASLVDIQTTPIVSFSVDKTLISEEDDDASFTTTFTVDGEIPEVVLDADGNYVSGGLSILVEGLADTIAFNEEISGRSIDDAVLGSFLDFEADVYEIVLLENTGSVTNFIFNDVIEEADQDYTFTLVNDENGVLGSNYTVNPDTASATFTLTDGVVPTDDPTVGITVTETELLEGDEFTVNFTVDGNNLPTPENPLTVLVDSGVLGAIGEFVIFDEDGNPAVEFEGIAGFPEVNGGSASGFLVDIIDSSASLTLSVFEDGPGEGLAYRREAPHCTVGQCRDDRRVKKKGSMPSF